MALSTDEQRDRFIMAFWTRRDPVPETPENEFKEEHYRRIAFANVHFAATVPGWKTDRGRVYITYGPPDKITVNTSSLSMAEQPAAAFTPSRYPYEVWHYQNGHGRSKNLILKFVDTCRCGDYQLQRGENQDVPLSLPALR